MRINNVLGLLFSNSYDEALPQLTALRTMGSVPFGGFYRLIDFPLSGMVSAGIANVGVVTKSNYRSLMDHLALGKPWDLSRKNAGMFLLPPFSAGGIGLNQTRMEGLRGALDFLEHSKEEYALLSDCHVLCNWDYRDILRRHIESGADISVAVRKGAAPKIETMRFRLDETGRAIRVALSAEASADCLFSLGTFVLRKALLERLIHEAISLGRGDFERDVIVRHLDALHIQGLPIEGFVRVIDSLQSYFDVSMELTSGKHRAALFSPDRPIRTKVRDDMPAYYDMQADVGASLVGDGCRLAGRVRGSVLFCGVRVEQGAVVENCVLMQSCLVNAGTRLSHVIADKNVVFRPGKTLIGTANYPIYLGKNIII